MLPEVIRDDAVNEYPGQDAGFLGSAFGPFRIQANVAEGSFPLPDIVLPDRHGRDFALRSLRGTKVFMIAWASW